SRLPTTSPVGWWCGSRFGVRDGGRRQRPCNRKRFEVRCLNRRWRARARTVVKREYTRGFERSFGNTSEHDDQAAKVPPCLNLKRKTACPCGLRGSGPSESPLRHQLFLSVTLQLLRGSLLSLIGRCQYRCHSRSHYGEVPPRVQVSAYPW